MKTIKAPLQTMAIVCTVTFAWASAVQAADPTCQQPQPANEGFANVQGMASKIADISSFGKSPNDPTIGYWHPFNNGKIGNLLNQDFNLHMVELVRLNLMTHSGLPADINLSGDEKAKLVSDQFSEFAKKELGTASAHYKSSAKDNADWVRSVVKEMQARIQILALETLKEKETQAVTDRFLSNTGLVAGKYPLAAQASEIAQKVAKEFSDRAYSNMEKAKAGQLSSQELLSQLKTLSNNPQKAEKFASDQAAQMRKEAQSRFAKLKAQIDQAESSIPSDVALTPQERDEITAKAFGSFSYGIHPRTLLGSHDMQEFESDVQSKALSILRERQIGRVLAGFEANPGLSRNSYLMDDEYGNIEQATESNYRKSVNGYLQEPAQGKLPPATLESELKNFSNRSSKDTQFVKAQIALLQSSAKSALTARVDQLVREANELEQNPPTVQIRGESRRSDTGVIFPDTKGTEGGNYIQKLLGRTDLDKTVKADRELWNKWLRDERLQGNFSKQRAYRVVIARGATLQDLLKEWSGVHEGYTIGEHEGRVINIFKAQEKYYPLKSLRLPKGVRNLDHLFEVMIGFHDIGKSIAVHIGDKSLQDEFNTPLLERYMKADGFNHDEVALASALVDNDILGDYLKKNISEDEAENLIRQQAKKAGMKAKDYFALQQLFYTCDSASYPNLTRLVYGADRGREIEQATSEVLKVKNPIYRDLTDAFGGDPLDPPPPPPVEATPVLAGTNSVAGGTNGAPLVSTNRVPALTPTTVTAAVQAANPTNATAPGISVKPAANQ